MSLTSDEIVRQPDAWRKAADVAKAADGLPKRGERVAVIGCGTSWFMAEAYAVLRETGGYGETDYFTASAYPEDRDYDRLVAITRSGTTTEVLDVLRRARETCPTVALTADLDTPVVNAADHIVDLGFADERSVVQTVFATTALATLRASLGEDIEPLAAAAQSVLDEPLAEEWLTAEQITFLGDGWAHGVAREAGLKMREAAQAWTESYPSMEYRHGPISIAAPNRLVWHFGRDTGELAKDVAPTGATFVDHPQDAQVDLVRVQRLAEAIARAKGLDPDRPRNLTRSVVLDARP